MDMENEKDIVLLTDDSGKEYEFEVLDVAEVDGNIYTALIPTANDPEAYVDGDGQLVLLKIVEDENGEESMEEIEDEEEFNRVLDEFEKRLEEDYEIQ